MATSSTPAARAPSTGPERTGSAATEAGDGATDASRSAALASERDPILCDHCGRSASNGLSCIGMCVADSGY
ncbi:MAG: hypothetical protein ACK46L_11425 [Synechococcaceae cyanobacterium]